MILTPTKLGNLILPNRVVMAPLTRRRADNNNVPTPMMADHYAMRASAGLIIAEATMIDRTGLGYPNSPGIWTHQQIEGWKKVTEAVHAKRGRIFLQIWHVGRYSHPFLQEDGKLPISASALRIDGMITTPQGSQPHVVPRALNLEEIPTVIGWYAKAAENAILAGFDGVEIHGANGYLIEQFLEDGSNIRTDEYGGSLENRARFLFEVLESVIAAIGSERTGLRLSPSNIKSSMSDTDPVKTFSYVINKLNDYKLAYLHLVEPTLPVDHLPHYLKEVAPFYRKIYHGTLISCGFYTYEKAQATLAVGHADLIAFGTLYIANPDLVERFQAGVPLNEPDKNTFYTPGLKGYNDYPILTNNR